MEAEIYQARARLGLFNVTLQSPFTTWLWAQAEIRKERERMEDLTTRERLVAFLLLLVAGMVCGKSFKGGVDQDIQDEIQTLRLRLFAKQEASE